MALIPRLLSAFRPQTQPDVRVDSTPPVEPSGPEIRADDWYNIQSGMGVAGFDKGVSTSFEASPVVPRGVLSQLYRSDGIASKVVTLPVFDATRNGFQLTSQDESADIEEIQGNLTSIGAQLAWAAGRTWARLYGNALVVAGFDDVADGDLSQPLGVYETIKWFQVFAAGYAGPVQRLKVDSVSGDTELYRVYPQGKRTEPFNVHASRCWMVQGVELPEEIAEQNGCWDDSVLQRLWVSLARVATADAAGANYLSERQYPVFKVAGLAGRIASEATVGKVGARYQAMALAKSLYRVILLDQGKEDFSVQEVSAGGIADMLNIYPNRVAAIANIPLTRLYGVSPGGLNATGEHDTRSYYDFVEGGEQKAHYEPFLRWVVDALLIGAGRAGESYQIEFNPLWSPSDKEQAETRKITADTDSVYIRDGVLHPDEVRASRFGGAEYSTETELDSSLDDGRTPLDDTVDPQSPFSSLSEATSPTPEEVAAEAMRNPVSASEMGVPEVGVPEEATILNGAQIQSLLSVTAGVTAGQVPPAVAVEALKLLGVAQELAERMVNEAASFRPAPTEEE